MKCPKCDGEMKKGVLFVQTMGGVPTWIAEKDFGIEVQLKKANNYQYACEKCGFTETYLTKKTT